MVKIKFDVRDSDPDKAVGQGNFEPPRPGVYRAKVVSVESAFAKDDNGKPDKSRPMLVFKYEITDKRAKGPEGGSATGSWVWDRVSMSDAAKWKLDQVLQAFGIANKKKRTGTLDTDALVGEECQLRIRGGTYNKSYSAEVGAVLAPAEDDDEDEEELEEDEELEDEDEELDEDDEEFEEDEDVEDEEDEDDAPFYDMSELAKMSIEALKDVASDLELTVPKAKSKNRVALSKWIFENQPGEPSEDEDEDEESEDDGYDDLSAEELKAECKDRGLATGGGKAALIKRLREDDEEEPF